jgi:hypothetical protein
MKKLLMMFLAGILVISACDLLENSSSGLSNEDIVEGLKTALEVGTDSSVTITSAVNGYYKDKAIKIFLPEEAQIIIDNISSVPGGADLLEAVILRINRSAEDAAESATPIFKSAITSLSITDGLSILNGVNPADQSKSAALFDSTAATHYLESTTYDQLVTAFSTPINASLNKKIVGNISTNEAWSDLTTAYNVVAPFIGKPTVNTNLGEHVTQKALDGIFLKVSDQERAIRRDPWKWISSAVGDILTKVFGNL